MANTGDGFSLRQAGNREKVTCYHCGDDCAADALTFEGRRFCCAGCKTVYEILQQSNLCNYYTLNETPGKSRKGEAESGRFAYLDDEAVVTKLTTFAEGGLANVTFYIPQMHCSSCIFLLENLFKIKPGIVRSRVNFLKREAHITYQTGQLSLRQVVETLADIGYEPRITLNDLSKTDEPVNMRSYYLKIGVAFFCFGNIMLLTFPEYLGIEAITESSFRRFFGILNFVLSLPVLLYSAREFFASSYTALKHRTLNMDVPITIGILAMFVRSSYEVFTHTGGGYFDTMASLVLLMLVGRLFQNKSYYRLSFDRDYRSYFPVSVTKVQGKTEATIPLTSLRVGDVIVVRNAELVPADAVLLEGDANIDFSFVTGEATPVSKKPGEVIYAGGKQVGKAIKVKVVKDVSNSYLTQLWNDSVFAKQPVRDVSVMAAKAGQWFTPVVLVIAFAALAYWWTIDVHKALNAFTSVLIITCPCALALSSPFTLGNMLRLLGKNGIYLKNGAVVEKMATVNTVVFDKTGTLTNATEAAVSFVPKQQGIALSAYQLSLIKSLMYHSAHPLSRQVYTFLNEVDVIASDHFKETEGLGIEGWIDENCVRVGSAKYLYGQAPVKDGDGATGAKVYVGINGEVLGYFLVKAVYRTGFEGLLKRLAEKMALYVVSGDNNSQAAFLQQYLPKQNLLFNQQPADKLQVVKQMQAEGRHIMMVGDGLNDAGALKQANVGVAISDNTNNFSPACDVIISSERFTQLYNLLNYARAGVKIILGSFAISILYNILGLYFALQGTMSPLVAAVLMPISSVTILAFTTVASTWAGSKNGFGITGNSAQPGNNGNL